MRRTLCAVLLLAVSACHSSTEPRQLNLASVYGIDVPATVSAMDTLTIRFDYSLGCERLDHLESSQSPTGITFAVWITNDGFPCLQFASQSGRHVQIILPPRSVPFTVRFKQVPRDSVIVVNATPPAPLPAK